MKKALSIILASCMTLSAMAQLRYQNRPPEKRQSVSQLERDVQKMVMATAMIYNYYVDSVDSKRLAEDAINGILKSSIRTRPTPMPRRRRSSPSRSKVRSRE